jgi:site-specific DNA-methyltransferase (adenine-specific)
MIGLNRIIVGDARKELKRLPSEFVDCVITSPPYYQLRDYGIGGRQLGLEASVDAWVDELRLTLNGLIRVLKPSGSLWLNLGDTYSRHARYGAPRKSLLLAPERLLLALSRDGWIVRNKVIWAKPNPMPNAARDRLSSTYELIYLATKQPQHFFDLDAIRVPHTSRRPPQRSTKPVWSVPEAWRTQDAANEGLDRLKAAGLAGHPLGKNPGDVWSIGTGSFRGAHFAVFPLPLLERPIRASCPERRCQRCRLPWKRPTLRSLGHLAVRGELAPTCDCGVAWEPGVVLDPFIGSGTTAIAAEAEGRNWLGIEINPQFARLAERRITTARVGRRDQDAEQREREAA